MQYTKDSEKLFIVEISIKLFESNSIHDFQKSDNLDPDLILDLKISCMDDKEDTS